MRTLGVMIMGYLFAAALVTGRPASAASSRLGAVKDNTLYEDAGGALSNGVGQHLFAGRTGEGKVRRGLIMFDIENNLPRDAAVTGAAVTLHMSRTATGAQAIRLHRVDREWGEGSSDAAGNEGRGAPSELGDATWTHNFHNICPWASAGGDFQAAESAAAVVDGVGSYTWGSTAGLVADVQRWLDAPGENFGWLLAGDEGEDKTTKRFDTRENANASNRPALAVEFDSQAEVVLNASLFGAGDSFTATFRLNRSIERPFTAFAVIELPDGKLLDARTLKMELKPAAVNVPSLGVPFSFTLLDTAVPAGAPQGAYRVIAAFFDPAGSITSRPDAFLEAVGPFEIR